jgi:hypothetical protein
VQTPILPISPWLAPSPAQLTPPTRKLVTL